MTSIVFYSRTDDPAPWREIFARELPHLAFRVDPDIGDPAEVHYTLVWKPPAGWHGQFPHLRAILSLGAGVDALLTDASLPSHVPVVRLLDGGLGRQMAEYAAYGVLHFHRRMHEYAARQRTGTWEMLEPRSTESCVVGVMGLGVLGVQAVRLIDALGFPVIGWSRTPKDLGAVETFSGAPGLDAFLARTRVLVNFLPLTPQTSGILDRRLFARLPRGSYLVNVARGGHLVEPDLLAALDDGQIDGALLDVFGSEPLPPDHPFWQHPKIVVTPHVAGVTLADEAAAQIIANVRRLENGEAPVGIVDRAAGY
ncbi:MAG: glyoxylate/hydroxypyruvate reductase A [Burkholderiales bacterium]|nr:glyoxylate/hydroxypyruvate reductase A [Burkholderiales bacterium]